MRVSCSLVWLISEMPTLSQSKWQRFPSSSVSFSSDNNVLMLSLAKNLLFYFRCLFSVGGSLVWSEDSLHVFSSESLLYLPRLRALVVDSHPSFFDQRIGILEKKYLVCTCAEGRKMVLYYLGDHRWQSTSYLSFMNKKFFFQWT